jgi:hypothetical protein
MDISALQPHEKQIYSMKHRSKFLIFLAILFLSGMVSCHRYGCPAEEKANYKPQKKLFPKKETKDLFPRKMRKKMKS